MEPAYDPLGAAAAVGGVIRVGGNAGDAAEIDEVDDGAVGALRQVLLPTHGRLKVGCPRRISKERRIRDTSHSQSPWRVRSSCLHCCVVGRRHLAVHPASRFDKWQRRRPALPERGLAVGRSEDLIISKL